MRNITSFTTACNYMWILQDQDGNEHRWSAGIGGVPKDMIAEAKAKGLEIWADNYGLIGRGSELGFVPLDNDARFIMVKFNADPEWGRSERSLYWISEEWYQELQRPDTVGIDPWERESQRRIAYRHEFLDIYLVRTRTETFRGHLNECEDWLVEHRFPMLNDEQWEKAMNGGIVEWPGRIGEKPEMTLERIR